MVCAFGEECWWNEQPSRSRQFKVGLVVISDLDSGKDHGIEVFLSVSPGLLPEDPEDSISPALFSTPRFTSEKKFELFSGLGHLLRFQVTGEPRRVAFRGEGRRIRRCT
jgi:hypothetical protein